MEGSGYRVQRPTCSMMMMMMMMNKWLIYSDSDLWLEFVSHNGLDIEVNDLRPADLHYYNYYY